MQKLKIMLRKIFNFPLFFKVSLCLFFFFLAASQTTAKTQLPENFVYVSDITSDIVFEIRYFTSYNFVGQKIDGYKAPVAILTKNAALALAAAARDFDKLGYVIKIFDAYRPTEAVDHFNRWSKNLSAVKNKIYFYPNVDKSRLFSDGYIAHRSAHSRGSAVDITLIEKATGKEIDMGAPFDFLDEKSNYNTKNITPRQFSNRKLLRDIMTKNGFVPYDKEWWHFRLKKETFTDTYFNFAVE
ncbi:MAG: M15 family metallopeptidase [Elusimicrobiota bacterium]|jgi:D-alanyl-D-alanine dipeptidase|nr:M15 family metallopeptidase [Elusimicrobiota bacterium]